MKCLLNSFKFCMGMEHCYLSGHITSHWPFPVIHKCYYLSFDILSRFIWRVPFYLAYCPVTFGVLSCVSFGVLSCISFSVLSCFIWCAVPFHLAFYPVSFGILSPFIWHTVPFHLAYCSISFSVLFRVI